MSELYDILTETPPTKVVLLALDQGLWDCERSLAELSALCEANHMEAVAQITQKRQTPETGIVLGSGKLEEASLAAQILFAAWNPDEENPYAPRRWARNAPCLTES